MTDVSGKWTFITGASRGIGRLAAKFMAQHGSNLILHARTIDALVPVVEELDEYGVEVIPVASELSDLESVNSMLAEIDETGIVVDIVLNNAGLQVGYRSDWVNTPIEDYPISFLVNTIAPMMICYHFLPGMIQRGFGRIVNTTSGIADQPEQAGYSAAKAALDKVTKDVGVKLEGTDVMINLTDPGWCSTDLGGPSAPNPPETAIPGVVLGVFLDDKKSGRIIHAQDFAGLTLEEAIAKM